MDAAAAPGALALARLWTMAGAAGAAGVAAAVGVVVMGVLERGLGRGLGLHLHSFGLVARLVAEFDEGHQHGQTQAPDKDVEDPRHVAQAEGLGRLVLFPVRREETEIRASLHREVKASMNMLYIRQRKRRFRFRSCTHKHPELIILFT